MWISAVRLLSVLLLCLVKDLKAQTQTQDLCASFMCLNGGNCTVTPPSNAASCLCPPPYTGSRCEQRIDAAPVDPCVAVVCHNGGECTSPSGAPVCICPPGFTGVACEIAVPYPQPTPAAPAKSALNPTASFSNLLTKTRQPPTMPSNVPKPPQINPSLLNVFFAATLANNPSFLRSLISSSLLTPNTTTTANTVFPPTTSLNIPPPQNPLPQATVPAGSAPSHTSLPLGTSGTMYSSATSSPLALPNNTSSMAGVLSRPTPNVHFAPPPTSFQNQNPILLSSPGGVPPPNIPAKGSLFSNLISSAAASVANAQPSQTSGTPTGTQPFTYSVNSNPPAISPLTNSAAVPTSQNVLSPAVNTTSSNITTPPAVPLETTPPPVVTSPPISATTTAPPPPPTLPPVEPAPIPAFPTVFPRPIFNSTFTYNPFPPTTPVNNPLFPNMFTPFVAARNLGTLPPPLAPTPVDPAPPADPCATVTCRFGTVCRVVVSPVTRIFTAECVDSFRLQPGVDLDCHNNLYLVALLVRTTTLPSYGVLECKNPLYYSTCPQGSTCVPNTRTGRFTCCTGKPDGAGTLALTSRATTKLLEKTGTCPKGNTFVCGGVPCQSDYDCEGIQKCCHGCGKFCTNPVVVPPPDECGGCPYRQSCVPRPAVCPPGRACVQAMLPTCVPNDCLGCRSDQFCQKISSICDQERQENGPSLLQAALIGALTKGRMFQIPPCYDIYRCAPKDSCGGCPFGQTCQFTGIVCIPGPCPASFQCVPAQEGIVPSGDPCGGCAEGFRCASIRSLCDNLPCRTHSCVPLAMD